MESEGFWVLTGSSLAGRKAVFQYFCIVNSSIIRQGFAIENEWRKFQVNILIRDREIEVKRSAVRILFLD